MLPFSTKPTALHAETDTDDMSCRAGHVQIGGASATPDARIDFAIDDEAGRSKLFHCSRNRGLAQSRLLDDFVGVKGARERTMSRTDAV